MLNVFDRPRRIDVHETRNPPAKRVRTHKAEKVIQHKGDGEHQLLATRGDSGGSPQFIVA